MQIKGRILVDQGNIEEGLEMLKQAAISIQGGNIGPMALN